MKRLLISVLCIMPLILCSAGIGYAGTAAQEAETMNITDAVSVFSELIAAGINAAGTQLASGNTGLPETASGEEPAAVSEEQPTEPGSLPAVSEPAAVPEEQPSESDPLPVISEEPETEEEPVQAPGDPEAVSVSTGIEVKDFYNSFKSNVKETGRHSVGFEEKGKKSSSKIVVDDNVEVFLRFSKEGSANMINRITFTEKISGKNAETIFTVMMQTLCDYLEIGFDNDKGSGIYEAVSRGESLVFSDLLLYGESGPKELSVRVYYTGSGYVEPASTSYTQSADDEFHALIGDLKKNGTIPDSDGSYYFHEDHMQEWARINWFQWETFDTAKNFVISADISWESASRTPNYSESGCGFIMRRHDDSNYLTAGLRLDGNFYIGGMKNGSRLSYGHYGFDTYSYKGNAQLVLVANGNKFNAYVDGAHMGKQQEVIVNDDGSLAFTIWSGTNKDYGIRCNFRNVFYYVWQE